MKLGVRDHARDSEELVGHCLSLVSYPPWVISGVDRPAYISYPELPPAPLIGDRCLQPDQNFLRTLSPVLVKVHQDMIAFMRSIELIYGTDHISRRLINLVGQHRLNTSRDDAVVVKPFR